jgi:hypothetical protein
MKRSVQIRVCRCQAGQKKVYRDTEGCRTLGADGPVLMQVGLLVLESAISALRRSASHYQLTLSHPPQDPMTFHVASNLQRLHYLNISHILYSC